MNIRFLGKNFAISEGMRDHLQEKLLKLEKYAPRLIESHVVLKKEKYLFDAQVTLLTKNFQAYGEAKRKENFFAAIDQACDRVEKQLKKFREKVKNHHHKEMKPQALSPRGRKVVGKVVAEAALSARRPEIMVSPDFAPKPMSAEEASLQLELSQESFLVFQNAVTRKVNVIYKRGDGNHGLIEPQF